MNILIVGTGLSGCTAAALLRKHHKVTLIDCNNFIGGMCHDVMVEDILVQKFGGHIFHTNNETIWNFVDRYTDFVEYKHKVIANTRIGNVYLPLCRRLVDYNNLSEQDIINLIYKDYSFKQWGCIYDELPDVIKYRVPKVKEIEDNLFFSDRFQGLPCLGYTCMLSNMIMGLPLYLGVPMDEHKKFKYDLMLYTGSVDTLFDYKFGMLPYRSLRHVHKREYRRSIGVINECTMDVDYIRSYDNSFWRQTTSIDSIITYEYSQKYDRFNKPYYPMAWLDNGSYNKYINMLPKNVILLGRLGNYRYMNMDEVIMDAMEKVEGILDV